LITGGSRGIGRATALRLARAGWEVHATVRRAEDGEALVAESGGAIAVHQLDVSSGEQIAALDGQLPERLDAVVNNAGIVVSGPLESLTAEQLREQFDVNVTGAVLVTNLVLPRLRASRGRVVFVSSVSGRVSTPMTGAYSASKFALEAIADAWRVELRPWGVKVVLIEPAMTDTDLWRQAPETLESAEGELSDEHRRLYAGHLDGMRKAIPRIQRMAKPVEGVAAAIERALTSSRPRARYVVGADAKAQTVLSTLAPTPLMDRAAARLTGTPSQSR
jgi:NAD(P)-dependent dehydrogenase (short-subunit alcohol dehydrogenase family)